VSSLQHKIDFAVVLKVKHANPNGDPLNGNRPRIDYNGYGEITDVCIKRKLRDRLLENGQSIFVQSDDRKKDDAKSLRDRAASSLPCQRRAKPRGRTRTAIQVCPFQSGGL
jgi:CRISPR-associated protein Csd2